MKDRRRCLLGGGLLLLGAGLGSGRGVAQAAAGGTPLAETTAAVYANLTQAADVVYQQQDGTGPTIDLKLQRTIVLYDAGVFPALANYAVLLDDVRGVRMALCAAQAAASDGGIARPNLAAPSAAGAGTLLGGVASLLDALKPTYTTGAQSLAPDQAAFQTAFVTVARRRAAGVQVILPGYALPAVGSVPPGCGDTAAWTGNRSFATEWRGAEVAAEAVRASGTEVGKQALEAYAAMRGRYLSGDGGRPLLAQVLVAETLRGELVRDPERSVVLDLRVDAMSANSVAKSFFGLKTTISTGVVGHYVVSRGVVTDGEMEGLRVVGSGVVDVLTKGMNDKGFGGKVRVVPGVAVTAGGLR